MKPIIAEEAGQEIVRRAGELGLDRIGFARADAPARGDHLRRWLKEGRAGTMTYLQRSLERRLDPARVLPGVRTVIVAGHSYFTERLPEEVRSDPSRGVIAAYAWGSDYHDILLGKLETLSEHLRQMAPGAQTRCYVDTGPVLEKELGERAGLGFRGKNTLLIAPRAGSLFFLGVILTTAEIPPSEPALTPSCGTCTRCLNACPTGALVEPYVLDASLCISYLTVEYRGVIPRELRPKLGNRIWGCDDCQDCCPWNRRFATPSREAAYRGTIERQAPLLADLVELGETEYRKRFAGTALARHGSEMLLRNVAVALGNWGSEQATDAIATLSRHEHSLVRLHAAWALGQTPGRGACELLGRMWKDDADAAIRDEAAWAITHGRAE